MLQEMCEGNSPVDALCAQKTTNHEREGRIELIIGPMFAGKTTELMRRVKREIHACRTCFVIKYARDTRYDPDNIVSHDNVRLRARAVVSTLSEVGTTWSQFDVIAIDEGQFFPDIVDFCRTAADAGRIVIISALDGDYLCRPFGDICRLLPLCESVTKLTAVCMLCLDRNASFTRRTVDNPEQELIGGAEMYIATCRRCYNLSGPISHTLMRHRQAAIRKVEEACLGSLERDTVDLTGHNNSSKLLGSTAPSTIAASPVSPECCAAAADADRPPHTALRWGSSEHQEENGEMTLNAKESMLAEDGNTSMHESKHYKSDYDHVDAYVDGAYTNVRKDGMRIAMEKIGQKRFSRESSPLVYAHISAAMAMTPEAEPMAKPTSTEA